VGGRYLHLDSWKSADALFWRFNDPHVDISWRRDFADALQAHLIFHHRLSTFYIINGSAGQPSRGSIASCSGHN
jgi:hypothetical protein